jgi:hypothetical protein
MIIGLCGAARAGKTTVANLLVDALGFEEVSFAGPIRSFVRNMLDVDAATFDHLKDVPHPLLGDKTPRFAMQTLGTEWGRTTLSPTLWIDLCAAKVRRLAACGKHVVISDVRFDNEALAIRALGGVIWHVERSMGPALQPGDAAHSSERGIAPYLIQMRLLNDGDLVHLHDKVLQNLHEI